MKKPYGTVLVIKINFLPVLGTFQCRGSDLNFHIDADSDPVSDPDWHQKTIPVLMRGLPQVLNLLENQNFTLSHSIASCATSNVS